MPGRSASGSEITNQLTELEHGRLQVKKRQTNLDEGESNLNAGPTIGSQ